MGMGEYKGNASILVADVDCTAAGKDLCETVGVEGFPTIKYGDPNDLEAYEGGRDFKSLAKFAKESLGPKCGPNNLDLCDADKKSEIEKFMAMPAKDLQAKIDEGEQAIKKAEKDLEELLKSLQSQYEEATKKKDDTKKEIKEAGLGLMKSVMASRKKSGKGEL